MWNLTTTGQTQSILRNIERLQPLLIVRDYQSSLAQAAADSKAGQLADLHYYIFPIAGTNPSWSGGSSLLISRRSKRARGQVRVRVRGKRRTASAKKSIVIFVLP